LITEAKGSIRELWMHLVRKQRGQSVNCECTWYHLKSY
jgi:hypothetical protein